MAYVLVRNLQDVYFIGQIKIANTHSCYLNFLLVGIRNSSETLRNVVITGLLNLNRACLHREMFVSIELKNSKLNGVEQLTAGLSRPWLRKRLHLVSQAKSDPRAPIIPVLFSEGDALTSVF